MNTAYKLIWSRLSNSWIVASELAKGRKKSAGKSLKLALGIASALGAVTAHAIPAPNTLPTGGVLSGNGTYSIDSSVPNQLTINQSEAALVATWNTFSIGSSARVIFNQPSRNSFTFNQVTGGSPSEIFGRVQANGHFVLVNPNGITFGAGSQVNAAAIVASTNEMDYVFFTGNAYGLQASSSATAKVENYGSLTATAGGVTLLGSQVVNAGHIIATGGDVRLLNAGATNFNNGAPSNIGASAITGFIQNSGSINATQVSSVGGRILLTGDTSQAASQIQLAGTLNGTETHVNGRGILVNGDVNLNGDSNVLNFTSTDGYSLNYGAAVNLNGASSGFNVNGTAYTVIRDVEQLQAMSSNLAGRYALAANIDASATSGWNAGAGFAPVGSSVTEFSGVLDGLGHQVNNLYINRPAVLGVGLIGYLRNGTVGNIGLAGHDITGGLATGALAGFYTITEASGSLFNSYALGHVSGDSHVGGLIGAVSSNSGILTIQNSYAGGTVTATGNFIGGLLGSLNPNGSTTRVQNSYATTTVSGADFVGGLIGRIVASPNGQSMLANSYATGNVSGNSYVGGLAGAQQAAFGANLSTQNTYASGSVSGGLFVGGLFGALLATPATPSSVSNSYWDMQSTGQSVAVGGNSNGTITQVVGLTSSQMKNLASFANWGSDIDAQAGTGSIWRIYEGHSTPLLRSFLQALTISINNPTASKTYDGTTSTLSYNLSNALADTSKIIDTFVARNVGSYAFGGSLYSTQDGYDIQIVNDGSLTINKRLLTISATAASKEYDGRLSSGDKPDVRGRMRGDSIAGLSQSYTDKNAGTGKTINVDAGFIIRDGNGGNNYDVVVLNNHAGVITPKALSISTVANSKAYDGGITSVNKPLVTGLLMGDRITGLFQQYETKTVGENKKLLVKSGYVLQDGNNGSNYVVTEQGSTDGVITAH